MMTPKTAMTTPTKTNEVSIKIKFSKAIFKKAPLSIAVLFVLIITVYPIVWVILSSFKNLEEFQINNPFSLPKSFNLSNYLNVFQNSNIMVYFLNSFIVLIGVVIGILFLSSTAAFAIEKLRFKHNNKVLLFFLLGIMVPLQIALIPLFQIYSKLGFLNSYLSIILPQIGFGLPIALYLFVAFFKNIPDEIIESATIDGCSVYRMYFSIILPMSKSIIVTVATLFGVFTWNEFIFAFTFISDPSMYTVTIGLRDFVGNYGLTDWGQTYSAITLTVLPTYFIYFFLSKHVMKGMTAGAVK
ncbi:carbohydrate ABC transporter permease [Bacillus sp. FJAT-50079]|uniref:carbohydrate ABC transporter permease n=1 Tax=Bacillus sp. FJAT-50079 TaxID=2833577 RepID=UPI001BCA3FFB|nr:carbohydrate ABC transporter permease [Bacillus sp. FJAT-50079]MBS4206585.1 carbohydrate ABC transporter permease [Bacillus sp. FJAT-50079]